ncbi:hypothetical protein BCR42DRAFT_408429 [Absidia repens]|uniref:Protein SQS1 n=1 Tax=Absidia repens TaxID=90262 RepID=A0A1X2IRD6_9FUNG|nr:hypothetical protein BCR42DRAFT_408429 [Absidia repens]
MGSKGQRGRNRSRGRGRGRGRGSSHRSGGHRGAFGGGQVRTTHPSIHEPTRRHSLEDDGDDFLVFGQFDIATDSDSDDLTDSRSKHSRRKAKIKKTQAKQSELFGVMGFQSQCQVDLVGSSNGSNSKSKSIGTRKSPKGGGRKGVAEYSHITDTSTHFVRSLARWNDQLSDTEDTKKENDSHSDDDDGDDDDERDIDLNNLHLDVGNLDINDDDLNELTSYRQPPCNTLSPSLDGADTSNDSEDSDSDNEDRVDLEDELTDHDIMQIVLQHEDDDAIRDYLDGLTTAQLDRLDVFFEQHAGELDDDDDDDDDDDEDDDTEESCDDDYDLSTYEQRYLSNHGLDDDEKDEISPDRFRISLEEALENVPTGLKPGVRNWISHDKKEAKRQKRLEKKERKREAKAKKQPNKDKAKRGGPNPEPSELLKIDSRIRDFINDDQLNSYQFAPMSKNCRRQLHLLSTAYNLKSSSVGTGKIRTPIITKTERTFIPQDRRYIDRFIVEAQSTITAQNNIARKHQMPTPSSRNSSSIGGGGQSKGKKGKSRKDRDQKQQPSLGKKKSNAGTGTGDLGPSSHGTVVASNAAPITGSNVGHRLLTSMGWKEGSGLGSNQEGITDPIEAIIRGKRRGLGA